MSLLAPTFLLGLLAVALPLWLHRLSSENPNRQSYSSLMFLEPGEPRRVLARRLQYLLLLALRAAFLILLPLTFAGPMVNRVLPPAPAETTALNVIVLDRSASMAFGQRWAEARGQALDILGSLPATAPVQVFAAGRRLELLSDPEAGRDAARQQLNVVAPGPYRIDYGQTMLALDSVLRAVELPIVLHFITDAQNASLPLRFAELAPRRDMELVVYDVSSGPTSNWNVESLQGSAAEGSVSVGVRGYGLPPDATRRLVLEQNGTPIREQSVRLGRDARATVVFRDITLAAGPNRITARLEPADGLGLDDERYLVLSRPEPRPVLLVAAAARGRDALFVDSALETLTELELDVARAVPGALAERSLSGLAFVVVTDMGALTGDDAAALGEYLERGGSALLALGARANSLTRLPVTGHPVRALAAPPGQNYQRVGLLDLQHPALGRAAALRDARFFRYAEITEQPGDVVLARLEEGQPLLLERTVGNGRVLVFASSLDREWTDLPLQPVYVPLIAGMATYLTGGSRRDAAELGSTLALRELGLPGGQIYDPDGRRVLGIGGLGEEVVLDQVGFYEAVGGGITELVAVNLDPRESDLERIDEPTLARWRAFSRPPTGSAEALRAASSEPRPWPLWPWLLFGLILAASVESAIGNWHLRVRRGLAT